MLLMMVEMKEKDGLPCSDWSLYTDMVKLIISQLDHSITLILFTSCLSLKKLTGCSLLPLESVEALLPALL